MSLAEARARLKKKTEDPFKFAKEIEQTSRAARCGDVELLQQLINKKFDINMSLGGTEVYGLRLAVEQNQNEIIKMWLKNGGNPFLGTNDNHDSCSIQPPLLHLAARNGNEEIVKLLLECGCNPMISVDGRKAKTIAKGDTCYQILRQAEADWVQKQKDAKPIS